MSHWGFFEFRKKKKKNGPAVYPSTSKESNEQQHNAKYPGLTLGRQVNKTEESCPWDFPDPPKIIENICPWEEGNTEATITDSTSKLTIKVDICPWETTHQDIQDDSQKSASSLTAASRHTEGKDSTRENVCPWETESHEKTSTTNTVLQRQERLADVCPWDNNKAESGESHIRQDTIHANICPWDTEEAGSVKPETSKASEKLQRQENPPKDVRPWETESPTVLKKQDSAREDVCPWETTEPKVLKKQDSARTDVCPWETEEPKVLKKQDSARALPGRAVCAITNEPNPASSLVQSPCK